MATTRGIDYRTIDDARADLDRRGLRLSGWLNPGGWWDVIDDRATADFRRDPNTPAGERNRTVYCGRLYVRAGGYYWSQPS